MLTYWLLVFMLWTTITEAASYKTYAVQTIMEADSTRPVITKKIPLRERQWFIKYRATAFKILRVLHYIVTVVAIACFVFILILILK